MLNCGIHACTSSCHQLFDHSKILCMVILTKKCEKGHIIKWKCHVSQPTTCSVCERAKKQALKKAQQDLEEQRRRDENQQRHLIEVAKIEAEIEKTTLDMKDQRIVKEQQNILAQKRKDLAAARKMAIRSQTAPTEVESDHIYSDSDGPGTRKSQSGTKNTKSRTQATGPAPPPTQSKSPQPKQPKSPQPKQSMQTPQTETKKSVKSLRKHIDDAIEHNSSPSKTEWQRQKDQENAQNPAIDAIMEMIGLEDVKDKILRIKAKVETAKRQNTDLKKERLGLVLLGNPGTGMKDFADLEIY